MKKKIVGIFVCMLMIATAVPAVISVKNSAINATDQSHPLASMAGNWTEGQKLLASDGAANDNFGYRVSLSGDTALIGAWYDDDNGANSGSAYVFTRTGTTWTQQAKLLASDGHAGDYFGCSVSLNGDTALIGAYALISNGTGSAYVFTRTGTTWTQQQKLTASDGTAGDSFGFAVALSGDTALIGAEGDDDNGNYSGSAYVFTYTGTTWTQQQKLLASDGAAGDDFGRTVSLDGDTALIGAIAYYASPPRSGFAYVFTRTGTTWTPQAKLIASDGAPEDYFGFIVSLSGDTALISAGGDDNYKGSAYVFIRTGTTWTQQAKLLASDGAAGDQFAYSVALSGDTALIGANGDNSAKGSAYVFTRIGTTWTQQQKLTASDAAVGDNFGVCVFLSSDTALIAAPWDDDHGTDSGSVYVFTKENQPPTPPTITGQASGKKGQSYPYKFVSTDPEGNNVSYYVDWGDSTNTGWIGPYISGHEIIVNHTWNKKGTYTIKAKAKDIYGNESDWATLKVSMPFSYNVPILTFWEWLFERFPHAFPILRHLLGY